MKQYTLREFLCANSFITMHRLFPEETSRYLTGTYWETVDPAWEREPLGEYGLDDAASWSEWETRTAG